MPVYTDLASAEIKRSTTRLYGVTRSRPTLLVSDGLNVIYACDVEISPTDPTGRIEQYMREKVNKDDSRDSTFLTGLPGQPPEDWQLDDSKPGGVNTIVHNVPISRNNNDVVYADVGAPVVLERSESGNWQITGFSMERPGTYFLYPVDLEGGTIGTVMDLTIETRLLTLAEIGEMKPFGILPFGASALFEGGELVQVI